MGKVVDQARVGTSGTLKALQDAWVEAVGREMAASSRVVGYRRGTVQIEANSAALAQELGVYHQARLVARLQQQTGFKIKDLRCRIGDDLAGPKAP